MIEKRPGDSNVEGGGISGNSPGLWEMFQSRELIQNPDAVPAVRGSQQVLSTLQMEWGVFITGTKETSLFLCLPSLLTNRMLLAAPTCQ